LESGQQLEAMSYTLDGQKLVLDQLAGTMMACPEPARSTEYQFLKTFSGTMQAVVAGTRLTLEFHDRQVSGDSGCNHFHGSFTVEGKGLTIGPLATTRVACDDKLMMQEQQFLAALGSATIWDIVQGMLDIHRANGERALWANRFSEQGSRGNSGGGSSRAGF
jgi:heat shock protein HslJ